MSRDLTLLKPDFRGQVERLLLNCHRRGFELRPFFTERTPQEQGALWRQSRQGSQVKKRIDDLRRQNCHFLADCIEMHGPQFGRWATNAIPGLSWHNYGLAIDCFVVGKGGGAIWNPAHEGYRVYAEEAKELGLTSGFYWRHRDAVHVQQPPASSPTKQYTLQDIDAMMRKRFG